MESVDITQKNIEGIIALFPNVQTETKDENGILKKAINFTLLKQELSDDVIDDECSICCENKSDMMSDCKHQYCQKCYTSVRNTFGQCSYCRNPFKNFIYIN